MPRSAQASKGAIRIYYYFVLGAIGGLTGWYFTGLLSINTPPGSESTGFLILEGCLLGAMIGLGTGVYDGIAARSFARVMKFGGVSMLLGMVAGGIALPLVQALYAAGSGSFVVGTLCWIIFGGLIGLGEGFSKGSQTWKGLVGGLAGGALGGGLYEAIGRGTMQGAASRNLTVLALAVSVLGGCIGSAVALVTTILKDAWLLIENGKLAGTEVNISKYVHANLGSHRAGIIGSSQWDSNIYLPGDSGVLPRHASISYQDGAPTLTALSSIGRRPGVTMLNNRPISSWPLSNGDRLQIGSTVLQYGQKRR